MSMKLSRREKVLVVAGSIIVIVVLYLLYFLVPYLNNMNDANKKLSGAQAQLNTLNIEAAGAAQLDDIIKNSNNTLKTKWSSIPVGINHARILLYLKELTDGKAENVSVAVPQPIQAEGSFQTQLFTLDFNTSYPELLLILDNLKKNALYNRVTLLKVEYTPSVTENATPAPGETGQAAATQAPTPIPTADINVITVHMEFAFYALLPYGSELPAPAMTPTNTDRNNGLMPDK